MLTLLFLSTPLATRSRENDPESSMLLPKLSDDI